MTVIVFRLSVIDLLLLTSYISLLDEVTHLVVVAIHAKECGGEEQELRAEEQHGVVNLSLRREEEGGSPEKDCRAPG